MIAPLRRLHRIVFVLLAILLPLLVLLALAARREIPRQETLPEALSAGAPRPSDARP